MSVSDLNRVLSSFAFILLFSAPSFGQNIAPVADAGSSRYKAGALVQLDGTGSYDPDGSGVLTYAWTQVSGPSADILGADTATPGIGVAQTDEVQECLFELVVSDGQLSSAPDTVKVIIVPEFGTSTLQLANPPFDPNKPTLVYFGGGNCVTGQGSWSSTSWADRANVIDFSPYGPDPGVGGPNTYYRYGDVLIVYLSSVAPDYKQPIQTSGYSTGGQPAIDTGIRLNLTYADARYAVNRVTFYDATSYCRDSYSESITTFLGSSVDGEQCWIDTYASTTGGGGYGDYPPFHENVLNVWFPTATGSWLARHSLAPNWYKASLTGSDMNQFNHGVVAGAYWSVVGPGKNLQLASTPGAETYKFSWYGNAASGYMDFYDESSHPGRLPEPVTLIVWRDPSLGHDDPNSVLLTCAKSQNAVGYQLLSGSDPHQVAAYTVVADTNDPPTVTAAMLPSSHTWWTVKARDAFGSTIYADPIPTDSPSGPAEELMKLVDFNQDWKVDFRDFSALARHWHRHEPSIDIFPAGTGESEVDAKELTFLAERWLAELPDPRLLAHWKLDEAEGNVACDGTGRSGDALVMAEEPSWRPEAGAVGGAIELDGAGEYIKTEFVLNPVDGRLSVFCWVKGGMPGQVVISQQGTSNWLMADASAGYLTTNIKMLNRGEQPLVSATVITDGQWHRIGLVREIGSLTLYLDGVAVASGADSGLYGSAQGLYIGVSKDRAASTFWSGLIDDVRIYNQAIEP